MATIAGIDRRAVIYWLAYGCVCVVAWLVFGVWVPGCQYNKKLAICKQNMHAIQLGLERYGVDAIDESYPCTIQVLIDEGYLDGLPRNPFTRQPMRALKPGDPLTRGDFSYQPMGRGQTGRGQTPIPRDAQGKVRVDSYLLTLY